MKEIALETILFNCRNALIESGGTKKKLDSNIVMFQYFLTISLSTLLRIYSILKHMQDGLI